MSRFLPMLLLGGCCFGNPIEKAKEAASEELAERILEGAAGVEDVELGPDGSVKVVTPDGTLEVEGAGEGGVRMTGADGSVVTVGEIAALPAGFPIPIYPGATVGLGATGVEGAPTQVVYLTTTDAPAAVTTFYRSNVAGTVEETAMGPMTVLVGTSPAGRQTVQITGEAGTTTVVLAWEAATGGGGGGG